MFCHRHALTALHQFMPSSGTKGYAMHVMLQALTSISRP